MAQDIGTGMARQESEQASWLYCRAATSMLINGKSHRLYPFYLASAPVLSITHINAPRIGLKSNEIIKAAHQRVRFEA